MVQKISVSKEEAIAAVRKADYKNIICCFSVDDEDVLAVTHRITHKASEDLPEIEEVIDRINDDVPCYVRMFYEHHWVEICIGDEGCTMIERERQGA